MSKPKQFPVYMKGHGKGHGDDVDYWGCQTSVRPMTSKRRLNERRIYKKRWRAGLKHELSNEMKDMT